MTVVLPSSAGGSLTHEVGYLEGEPATVAQWLQEGLGPDWVVRSPDWDGLSDAVRDLEPVPVLNRYGVIPMGVWSLILSNGPRGTDVGLLPSQSARELGGRGIRAVCVEDDDPGYSARILEIYGPDGSGPLKSLRSIVAANDGGEWIFETAGTPLSFEHADAYKKRRKSDRFPSRLLFDYLREVGVPVDDEPAWNRALMVELESPRSHGQG